MKIYTLHILLALLLSQFLPAVADNPAEDFAASLRADRCAVLIVDLKNDSVLAEHNSSVPLIPASITKSITIASALLKSGPGFIYHTRVYADGRVRDGVLDGNLVIEGGGDPSLGADVEPKGTDIMGEIVAALNHYGIKEIKGRIIVDSSIFPAPATHPTWGSGDLSRSYGTGCHGLNYRRNACGKSAVKDPETLFVRVLESTLGSGGVVMHGDTLSASGKRRQLLDHQSPPVNEIMRSCMMRSDNLYAEALLRTLAMLNKKSATTDAGTAIETEFWNRQGAPMNGVSIIDGSGLSRANRLTADFLAYVLKYMADNEEYVSFFPLAGQDGTTRKLFKGTALDSYVALKTGTMRGVRCLAGYKLDDNFAPTHVIVIIANDYPGGASTVNAAAQKMLLELF